MGDPPPSRLPGPLRAFAHRDFRLFWFGLVVSNIGSWMQIYGLGWLVVQLAIRDGAPQLAPFVSGHRRHGRTGGSWGTGDGRR